MSPSGLGSANKQSASKASHGRPRRERFPASARLLRHSDFEEVYARGRRHFSGNLTMFYLARQNGGPRVGFTVARALGDAVQRNRIKRRLREAVRHHLGQLRRPVDVVINAKPSALKAEFAQLLDEIARAFELIGGPEGSQTAC